MSHPHMMFSHLCSSDGGRGMEDRHMLHPKTGPHVDRPNVWPILLLMHLVPHPLPDEMGQVMGNSSQKGQHIFMLRVDYL